MSKKIGYGFPFGSVSFDYLVYEWFEALKEAGDVAGEALDKIEKGTFDGAAWSKSMVDLTNISVKRYVECAGKVLGHVDDGPVHSAEVNVDPDPDNTRRIEILSLTRVGMPSITVPLAVVSCEPQVLPFSATRFTITVSDSSWGGHAYIAKVYLHKLGINPVGPVGETVELPVPL